MEGELVFLPELNCFGYKKSIRMIATFKEDGTDASSEFVRMLLSDPDAYQRVKQTQIENDNFEFLAIMEKEESKNKGND